MRFPLLERMIPRQGREEPGLAQRLEAVERRLQHLEAMLEGLQDAVHRESVRQGREIDQLQKKAQPGEIRRALSEDARDHGI
jgi:predicted RNase H-like nuclease (RuvC/YqgF family)